MGLKNLKLRVYRIVSTHTGSHVSLNIKITSEVSSIIRDDFGHSQRQFLQRRE